MTPAIQARAEQIALDQWHAPLAELSEAARFDVIKLAIEADRLARLREAIRMVRVSPNYMPNINTEAQSRLW